MLHHWAAFAEEWELYHKVTFDGETRRIIINPGETTISVKIDIYSAWKRWVATLDYAKYLPAIRTIGGDPVGGGLYAGDIYFLMNGWQVVVSENTAVTGTLYHDDSISPWVVLPGGGVIATVSNLAYAYSTSGGGGSGGSGATAAEVWAFATRTLTTPIPTAVQNRQEMDANSTQLAAIRAKTDTITASSQDWSILERNQIRHRLGIDGTKAVPVSSTGTLPNVAAAVWDESAVAHTNAGSTGLLLNQIKADTGSMSVTTVSVEAMVRTILKYDKNRTKIDTVAKTLIVYDNDGVTPIQVFNLRDSNGQPSVVESYERIPTL